MAIPLGNFEFNYISFNAEHLGNALNEFVTQGSKKGSISIDNLNIIRREGEENVPFLTVQEAVENGTRLFDALAYFSLPEDRRPRVLIRELEAGDEDPKLADISEAVFYIFMWILIRGTAPKNTETDEPIPVPKFLTAVMQLREEPYEYVQKIASFDLSKMDPQWIKYIKVNNLGREAQNRLALGIAGYRLPAALSIMQFREDADPEDVRAANAVIRFVRNGLTWDCCAVTRSQRFLERVRNFNANVGNLIIRCAQRDTIDRFVRQKILFTAPEYQDRFQEYRTWTNETFAEFTDYIFPQQ